MSLPRHAYPTERTSSRPGTGPDGVGGRLVQAGRRARQNHAGQTRRQDTQDSEQRAGHSTGHQHPTQGGLRAERMRGVQGLQTFRECWSL